MANFIIQQPVRIIGKFRNQNILRLACARAMVVDLMTRNPWDFSSVRTTCLGIRVVWIPLEIQKNCQLHSGLAHDSGLTYRIEETLIVMCPLYHWELDLFQRLREVLSRGDISDTNRNPIAPFVTQSISYKLSIMRKAKVINRQRSVLWQLVGVKKYLWFGLQGCLNI